MTLRVSVPSDVPVNEEVTKIKAEAEDGWFCILPRHVDFVTSLVPGILSFALPGGNTEYLAIDHGILVKCGAEVSISTRIAVRGTELGVLRAGVEQHFRTTHEGERTTRELEARLESDLVRRLVEMEKYA